MRDLNNFFGFVVDVSLLNSIYETDQEAIIEYLRREAENMVLKIKGKGTTLYHNYIFDRIARKGYVYSMFYNDGVLHKALNFFDNNTVKIQDALEDFDFTSAPFTNIAPLFPFNEGFVTQNSLDKDKLLDDTPAWTFDYSLYGSDNQITKHIAAELIASETYTFGTDTVLVTNDQLEYLRKSILFGKRATEIPHAGIGFTAYSYADESPFVTPSTIVTTSITNNWTLDDRSDLNALYDHYLVEGYYEGEIKGSQIYSDDRFDVINISFPGNKVYPEVVGVGNGTTTSFSNTLALGPIDKGTFKIIYEDINSTIRTIVDDSFGNLYYPEFFTTEQFLLGEVDLADYQCGTINYVTGEISFSTIDTSGTAINITPKSGVNIASSYYSLDGMTMENVTIKNSTGDTVVTISFPKIQLLNKLYHASILLIIDRSITV